MIIPSKCPHCGAQIIFKNNPITECDYCNSIVMLEKKEKKNEERKEKPKKDKNVVVNNIVVNIPEIGVADAIGKAGKYAKELAESFNVRELKPSQKILARYELGETHQRGQIFITDFEIVFKPFDFNKGDKNIRYIPFTEINSISSKDSEYYFFAKRISFNLHGGKRIHIHIKNKYSKLFIQEIKDKKSFNAKNKIYRNSMTYDGDINGAVNAKDIVNYNTPKYVKTIKKLFIKLIPIITMLGYGVHHTLKKERLRGGGSLSDLLFHSIPKEIGFIITIIFLCFIIYIPWRIYKQCNI